MEFLDLSDANDDEKAEAMAIIGSGPLNGVEFPFEFKSEINEFISETRDSLNSSPQQTDVGIDGDLNQSMVESQSLASTPTLRAESSPTHEFVSHSSERIQTSNSLTQWEMSAPSSGPPQYIYHQTPPHYYVANAPMPGHYYSPVPNGAQMNMNSNKDMNKMRPSGSIVNSGKSGKPNHSPDIRTPFYSPPNQYSEVSQLIDGNRPVPTSIVSDGMVAITNAPPVQPMFTPGFAHPFISPHSPFPAPQVYLIATPEGSYFTYLPASGVQMPRPSSPPTVPNVNLTDDNSVNTCKVPLIDNNCSETLSNEEVIEMNNELNEDIVIESNEDIDCSEFENNETINELNANEVKVCDNNESKQSEISSELLSNESNDKTKNVDDISSLTTSASSISSTLSPSSSTSSATNTTASNVWASSQRSWADLFKASSSASIHNSVITSSNLTQTSSALTTGSIVSHSYNNLSESDSHLNSSVVISCESEAQIQCIPMRNDPFARKLAKRVKEIGLKHSLPYLIPSGFVNRGNWCYINATLQALLGCPPFYNLMREIGETPGLFRERSSTPIIDSFAMFFTHFTPSEHLTKKQKSGANMSSEDMPKGEPIEPRCVYDVLGAIKSECLKGRQEDAEEFLSSVLNGLHEEMISLFRLMSNDGNERKPLNGEHLTANGHIGKEENGITFGDVDENDCTYDDDDANLWKEVSSRHKPMPTRSAKVISTPIFDIFGGSTLSVRTAGKDICGNRQPFFALQLDIQSDKVKSVEDALKCLTTSESILGYIDPKTRQAMDASAQTFLDTLPPILILHLKLFVYDMDGGCRKLMKRIEYPVDLELPKECLHYDKWEREKNLQLKRYKLLSVVYHDGAEAIKGHYVTDVYHIGSNQWLRCDDGSVKVIPIQRVLNTETSRTPYLLFYRQHDTLYGKNIVLSNNSKTFSH